MPYGVDKKEGGDNPSNTRFMESCVKKIMAKGGLDKVSAIKICKKQLSKKKEKRE